MYNIIPRVKLSYVADIKPSERPLISCSKDAERILRAEYDTDQIEHIEIFSILLLNRQNGLLGFYEVSRGGICGTVVDPRIILQSALLANASKIILCHNHPSGNLKPSQPDIEITKKVCKAADFMDIGINDHIILIPEAAYFSFADNGLI